ncbi:MAG: hypothetical protein AAB518_00285 [Patescibacteria group bacterium]
MPWNTTTKKIIGFSLIGGAVAFASFTVLAALGSYRVAIDESMFENPAKNPVESVGSVSPSRSEQSESNQESDNMTASIAKSIAAALIEKNPQGPSFLEGKTGILAENPEDLIDATLVNALESFDYQTFKPAVAASDITVQENPTSSHYESYLRESQKIIRGTYAGLSFNPETATTESLRLFENAALTSVAKLKILPVPAPLAPFHREEISLISAEAKVFRALIESDEDAVGALVALQALYAIDADFKALTKSFNQFLVEKKIVL